MITNVLQLLENSTAASPDKTAVTENDRHLTYAELTDRSRRAGSALSSYVTCGHGVGVYMEKGIDALCAFFGTVYAGGFYTMLNTELPDQRLSQIYSVLQAKAVITTDQLREKERQFTEISKQRRIEIENQNTFYEFKSKIKDLAKMESLENNMFASEDELSLDLPF